MVDIAPIPNALKVKTQVTRSNLMLCTSGDLRLANPRGPWNIEGVGSIEIDAQGSGTVAISLSENKASDDTVFGSFQPPLGSGPAYLNLLLSPPQWQMMADAMHGTRDFELLIDAVVSLDVPLADYSRSYGGEVMRFRIVLAGAPKGNS